MLGCDSWTDDMKLKSKLFSGDAKLEAASQSHPAHIVPGAVGDHVARIQQALARLDSAAIDVMERETKRYGSSTANAVLAYKKKRNIINPSYQTQADNIVGIMTVAAMDNELLAQEITTTITVTTIKCDLGKQTVA
jgi:peptidoglycan hydrolase-like protein with peptidoglycan-binding domain